jgi:hypothetical protein
MASVGLKYLTKRWSLDSSGKGIAAPTGRPAGVENHDVNDGELSSRPRMLARTRYRGRRRRSRRDHASKSSMSSMEWTGTKMWGRREGWWSTSVGKLWNVHGGPWCSLSAPLPPSATPIGGVGEYGVLLQLRPVSKSAFVLTAYTAGALFGLFRKQSPRGHSTIPTFFLPPAPKTMERRPPQVRNLPTPCCSLVNHLRRHSLRDIDEAADCLPIATSRRSLGVLASHLMCKRCAGSRRSRWFRSRRQTGQSQSPSRAPAVDVTRGSRGCRIGAAWNHERVDH